MIVWWNCASNCAGSAPTRTTEKDLRWDPAQTAIIICDMWNQHWCQGATRRVGELAPAINRAIAAARGKGVFIIHAPSSCMDAYKEHPARRRAQAAPRADLGCEGDPPPATYHQKDFSSC